VSTLGLKPCIDPTALPVQPGSGAARPPPSASEICPRQPARYTSPRSSQQNRTGNGFPLASRQGFLHALPPFSAMLPLGPPSIAIQIRHLGLCP
jgi:hypothetical protein